MLRLKNKESHQANSQMATDVIAHDFADPYLELMRLLHQAAGLEQLLMLQYLYAAFSIKDEYASVRGGLGPHLYLDADTSDLLGVSVQEMQHLHWVNEYLVALGAAPNLAPQEMPYASDVYPFELTLKPLSRYTTATYLFIEADDCALSLKCKHSDAEIHYIKSVLAVLGQTRENHLGSLYASIIGLTRRVAQNPPAFLSPTTDWNRFENTMLYIAAQGEEKHYQFFKSVFTASHPGFGGVDVWNFAPDDARYPSVQFDPNQTTAYAGQENEICDPVLRDIAWLSNLHYWIILSALDASYRFGAPKLRMKAVGNMTEALYSLAFCLARKGIGVPFDPPGMENSLGSDLHSSLQILRCLVLEAEALANRLSPVLPPDFNFKVYPQTLAGLLPAEVAAVPS